MKDWNLYLDQKSSKIYLNLRAKEAKARDQEEREASQKRELAACKTAKEKQNLLILWNKQNQKTEVVAKPNQSFMDFYSPSH